MNGRVTQSWRLAGSMKFSESTSTRKNKGMRKWMDMGNGAVRNVVQKSTALGGDQQGNVGGATGAAAMLRNLLPLAVMLLLGSGLGFQMAAGAITTTLFTQTIAPCLGVAISNGM